MMWRVVLPLLLVPLLAAPGSAGIFGKKKPPIPAERVPELINTLQTDGDENKRSSAAEELREYDPVAFPQMVPALIDALQNDKKPSVRAEAAQTLGKLRPTSQNVAQALEQAREKDPTLRVRLQARSSLLWYGHRVGKTPEPPLPSKEGPPGEPKGTTPPVTRTQPSPPVIRTQPGPIKGQTTEPPLAPLEPMTSQPALQPIQAKRVPTPSVTTTTVIRPGPKGSKTTFTQTEEPPLAPPLPPSGPTKTEPVPVPLPAPKPTPADQSGPELGPQED